MARFTLPRDLYHGKGALENLKNLKGKKAIVCVGGGSMKRFGFLDRAVNYLKEAGMEVALIEGIESEGYTFRVSPMVAYALRDNMALGARFAYGRTLLKLDKANLSLGDEDSGINLQAKDFYSLKHSYTVSAIWRQYIPLGRNKRFALFNEMQLSVGGSQARFANDSPVKGTYETGTTLSLGITPGIVAFATNNMAVEVNVGVMGISYAHTKQVHNQVTVGKRSSSMMNFKVNIFSIGLGMAFYL